jgi:multidrug efflux pump
MHISAPFIRRPVATSLLSLAIILAGATAYKLLPVASLPQVEFPTISVSASLPGQDPETMASAVATPLERQFGRIAGVTQMTSSSSLGATSITLQFDLNRDINGAARDVQAAINAARDLLPANLPSNPQYRKINPSESPIVMLALTSDVVPIAQIYDAADSVLGQKISQVQGVGQVNIGGSSKPAVRIELNPQEMEAYGISLEQVRTAMSTVNVNLPKGSLHDEEMRWNINATDQLFGADAYAPLIIAYNNGAPVRLRDIARVWDSVENIQTGGLVNGKPAIIIQVFKSPGANVIESVDNVLKVLPALQASISPAIHLQVAIDRTTTIRASVKDVTEKLLLSVSLVILVVFFFLREVRSTIIPSISVPLSLLGTFGLMYLFGFTLDNLSLMALTISTGFVVDDAIVVIENIMRHVEGGMAPFEAAMQGSREIGFTVLSMSISLIAVFIPLLLMGGIVGRLFREFSITLAFAILVSMVVSLTTTPMLCAHFLKPHDEQHHGWFYMAGERGLQRAHDLYASGLRWVLGHTRLMMAVWCVTFILNIYLYVLVPKGFFPQQDTGRLGGQIRGPQDVSYTDMKIKMTQLAAIVKKEPSVDMVLSFMGAGPGGGSSNQAGMFVGLKPLNQRPAPAGKKYGHESADQVIANLRGPLNVIPGYSLFLQSQQDLQIGGRQSAAQYQYTLVADNLADLNTWAPLVLKKLQTLPQLREVNTDQQNDGLLEQVVYDRETASRLGISPQLIDNTLYDAFGQRDVSTTYMPLNQYHVVMEVDLPYQQNPDALREIYVPDANGTETPLAVFTHYESKRTALNVAHQGTSPASTISFNLAPGVALSQVDEAVSKATAEIGLPPTIHGAFQGTAQSYQQSLKSEPWLIVLAVLSVYIVLGMLYESFIHPLTILSTLPSAGVGAIVALLLSGTDLSVIAMIGIILLIGIVKKNAIMMIDFALQAERDHNWPAEKAIYEASLLRFRPIMMTTMAALLGGLPLAFGTGVGSELRRPLGITIVGGLIVSQMLTLFTTPVVYLFFDKVRAKIGAWSGRQFPRALAADGTVGPEAAVTGD